MNDYDPNFVYKKTYALVGQKAIVLNKDNKILMLHRSEKSGMGGKWSAPGGALDKEDPTEGIRREIIEEAQLEVTDLIPFAVRSYTKDDGDFVLMIGYTCRTDSDKVILNWEHDEHRWCSRQEALELDCTPDGRYFVEKFKQKS